MLHADPHATAQRDLGPDQSTLDPGSITNQFNDGHQPLCHCVRASLVREHGPQRYGLRVALLSKGKKHVLQDEDSQSPFRRRDWEGGQAEPRAKRVRIG